MVNFGWKSLIFGQKLSIFEFFSSISDFLRIFEEAYLNNKIFWIQLSLDFYLFYHRPRS